MAKWSVRLLFRFEPRGWKELYYFDQPDAIRLEMMLAEMLPARLKLMGQGANLASVRYRNLDETRNVGIFPLTYSSHPLASVTAPAVYQACWTARIFAGPRYWRHLYLRGIPWSLTLDVNDERIPRNYRYGTQLYETGAIIFTGRDLPRWGLLLPVVYSPPDVPGQEIEAVETDPLAGRLLLHTVGSPVVAQGQRVHVYLRGLKPPVGLTTVAAVSATSRIVQVPWTGTVRTIPRRGHLALYRRGFAAATSAEQLGLRQRKIGRGVMTEDIVPRSIPIDLSPFDPF